MHYSFGISGAGMADSENKDVDNATQLKEFVAVNLKNVEVKDEHKV